MIARWMVALLSWSCVASSAAGQGWLVTRLWFENLTRGTDNAGALLAEPGDRIAIRFMTQVDPLFVMKWGTFQATLILDGLSLMGDDDANSWVAQASSAFSPPTWYPIRVFHQPDYGPMYDNAVEPTDPSYPLVSQRGLYALIGATDRSGAQNSDRKLFEFTVRPGSVGEELHWSFPGRITGTGLSTRVIDSLAVTHDPTDNFVRVVPEPSALWGLLGGLALLRRPRAPRFRASTYHAIRPRMEC